MAGRVAPPSVADEEALGVPGSEEGLLDVGDVGLEVPGLVGVVGDEGDVAGKVVFRVLPVEDLLDEGVGLLEVRGGEASEGEVGEEVLSVDRGEGRVRGGPQVRGLRPQRRQRGPLVEPGEVPGVEGGVSEEEDVARRGLLPGVEGEGEEVADGLGGGAPPPKSWAMSSREAA